MGPSPPWMRRGSTPPGCGRSTNVVDITNYVMLETGQPLHAFDLDRVAGGTLRSTRPRPEKLTTLDGKDRKRPGRHHPDRGRRRPASIAGVIGGARSEVLPTTTRVAMEVATWHGPSIHATSWALPVRTEASSRNEKGLPVEQVLDAQRRALQLMGELAGAKPVGPMIDLGTRSISATVLQLPGSFCKRVLGSTCPRSGRSSS